MVKMQLQPGFKLSEATPDDLDEQFSMLELAFIDDEIWKVTLGDVLKDPQKVHAWIMEILAPRWTFPDIVTYKITEEASGKIVAWTALQFPWRYKPMSGDLKAHATSKDMPPLLPGMHEGAAAEFLACLGGASLYGYDPEVDYHRKGTMVHPEFQKRGFGSVLTLHVHEISDKSGDMVWAPARPTSVHMFRQLGFKDIGVIDAHLERWGGSAEKSKTWIVKRGPSSAIS